MKILHLITALNVGGAETMLAKLLEYERNQRTTHQFCVVSLMAPGIAGERISAGGTPLRHCGLEGPRTFFAGLRRLRAIIREEQPDLVMAWMYHAHLAALMGTVCQRGAIPVIWNVRHSIDKLSQEKPATRVIIRLAALLSGLPRMIIYNSHTAAQQHQRLGFRAKRTLAIPNGFDSDHFQPRKGARAELLARFDMDPAALIIGMAARNHPMKDAANLVEAVRRATDQGLDIHLLLMGQGMDQPSGRLAQLLSRLPANRVTLRGHEGMLAEVLPGLDLLVLPSAWGEGFPNILGEAMACGTACIATDVGDSRWIVGNSGVIVPPRDPGEMTKAILMMAKLGSEGRQRLGMAGRERVKEHFSMRHIARQYAALYHEHGGDGAASRLEKPRPAIQQKQVM